MLPLSPINISNHLRIIDSKHALDAGRPRLHSAVMANCYRIYTERRDAAENMARFHALSIERVLFGEVSFVDAGGGSAHTVV